MPATTSSQLSNSQVSSAFRSTPAIVDVRIDDDYRADPGWCRARCAATTGPSRAGRRTIAARASSSFARRGQKLSEGTAAWLRHGGIDAQTLEGGFEAWKKASELLVRTDKLPPRDDKGRTVWVTRSRPKVDRIACPWLIRRFIDPNAVFPLRLAVGGHRRRRTIQGDALRHRRRVLEPSRRDLHLRHDDRGVRLSRPHPCCSSPRSCAAPTRHVPISRRNRRACWPRRSAIPACTGTTSRSSRRPWASTTPSTAGVGTRTSETHNWPSAKPKA